MLNSIAGLANFGAAAATGTTGKNPEAKIKDAAQQFEALMIGQLLKSAKGDGESGGWLGAGEDDQTGQSAVDYAQQQLASVISKNGGIGLTDFIVHGLHKKV
jgi:Rod binding domain-containing protein